MVDPDTRRVVCAALMNSNGVIVCGPRHYDHRMHKTIEQMGGFKKFEGGEEIIEGFVCQWGEFMDREEAHVIATRRGQIIRRCGGDEKRLYSENLY
jgi:hypothetical protein